VLYPAAGSGDGLGGDSGSGRARLDRFDPYLFAPANDWLAKEYLRAAEAIEVQAVGPVVQ
jgi:hypothetical protein